MEWIKIPTSAEVWAAIRAEHKDVLKVFSSFSAPEGDYFGNTNQGVMMTEWGFDESEIPLIGAETKWDIEEDERRIRHNEITKYWICVPVEDEE